MIKPPVSADEAREFLAYAAEHGSCYAWGRSNAAAETIIEQAGSLASFRLAWGQEKERAEMAEARADQMEDQRDAAVLALRNVVATLGPDELCDCAPGDETCGLRDEAYHALRLARAALSRQTEPVTLTRMLGKTGTKNGLAGDPGHRRRCGCGECDMNPTARVQRKREEREWNRTTGAAEAQQKPELDD